MKFLSFTISRIFYLFVIVLSVTKDHPHKANYLGMLFERSSKSFHNSALCTLHSALPLHSAFCILNKSVKPHRKLGSHNVVHFMSDALHKVELDVAARAADGFNKFRDKNGVNGEVRISLPNLDRARRNDYALTIGVDK